MRLDAKEGPGVDKGLCLWGSAAGEGCSERVQGAGVLQARASAGAAAPAQNLRILVSVSQARRFGVCASLAALRAT